MVSAVGQYAFLSLLCLVLAGLIVINTVLFQKIFLGYKIAPMGSHLHGRAWEDASYRSNNLTNAGKVKPKIAYIFAGAVRSFTCPQVHWTIKTHLIDALGGDPYVFIRLSYEDNKNVKTGDGIVLKPRYNDKEINETLRLLNPVVIESFKLSTQIEEMQRYYPQPIHTVFRENDNRRYSMFFHRCRAYRLMLKYEVDHNMTFDWVVLVRLDATWIAPLLPIEAYNNDRVWLTETGYDTFNDQFMLIPRQFSDYLYDLNTKVTKEVYCLGGPDVEQWKCNRTELQRRGVSEEKIASVLPYCCADIFTDFNGMGWSEIIHRRHLKSGKIPVSLGRFPVALTRVYGDYCEVECFRVYSYMYKEYVFLFKEDVYPYLVPSTWPDTLGRSIHARDREMCYIMKEKFFPWQPISAYNLHVMNSTNGSSSGYQLDYRKRLVDQLDRVHPSIIINPKDTEFWRIHPTWNVEGCLMIMYDTMELVWEQCIGHYRKRIITYYYAQLFYIYVIPERRPADRAIGSHSYQRSSWFPESTYKGDNTPNITRLVSLHYKGGGLRYSPLALCLTASALREEASITMKHCSKDMNNKFQNLLTVRTQMDGSHPHSTIGQLAFAAAPHLCVARDDNKEKKDHFDNTIIFPMSNKLFVFRCDWKAYFHQNMFEFELMLS